MNSIAFINTVFTFLHKNLKAHIAIFIISSSIIFILSSFLFASSSIKNDILDTLKNRSDFILQKINSSQRVDLNSSYMKSLEDIKGVGRVFGRVYGRYLLKSEKKYINIIGVDLFSDSLGFGLDKIDLKKFLAKDHMILSTSLKSYFKKRYFTSYYNFYTPNGDKKKVYFYDRFESSKLPNIGANYIVMSEDLAREILGIESGFYSDIAIEVKNEKELDMILQKIESLFFDTKIVDKRDILSSYERFFEYKSSIFLILFTVTLFSYTLILYFRYTLASSSEKRDIAILRMLGWSVNDVIKLKLFESIYISLLSFLVGISLSYIYVFYLDAPFLRDIFLGFGNIKNSYKFHPNIDLSLIFSIFVIYITSFVASLLIPVWRIATGDIKEAVK